MEFCRESEKSRGEVLFDIEYFRIVCWVCMQVDMGSFEARGVFLMSLIKLIISGKESKESDWF
jgi:hypothetical protein